MDVLSRAHRLEAAGRRVIHMEIGEPDFTAPAPVVEAADTPTAAVAPEDPPKLEQPVEPAAEKPKRAPRKKKES